MNSKEFKASRKHQKGISLMESLVAIVVMAVGALGVMGSQVKTLTETQTAVRRAQSVMLIDDLGERIKSHPNGLGLMAAYVRSWEEDTTSVDCESSYCSPEEMAAANLSQWVDQVRATLPLGDAAVFLAEDNSEEDPRQIGVMLSWRESESGETSSSLFNPVASADIKCPEKRTCHMQFISPGQRCVPDSANPEKLLCAKS